MTTRIECPPQRGSPRPERILAMAPATGRPPCDSFGTVPLDAREKWTTSAREKGPTLRTRPETRFREAVRLGGGPWPCAVDRRTEVRAVVAVDAGFRWSASKELVGARPFARPQLRQLPQPRHGCEARDQPWRARRTVRRCGGGQTRRMFRAQEREHLEYLPTRRSAYARRREGGRLAKGEELAKVCAHLVSSSRTA